MKPISHDFLHTFISQRTKLSHSRLNIKYLAHQGGSLVKATSMTKCGQIYILSPCISYHQYHHLILTRWKNKKFQPRAFSITNLVVTEEILIRHRRLKSSVLFKYLSLLSIYWTCVHMHVHASMCMLINACLWLKQKESRSVGERERVVILTLLCE